MQERDTVGKISLDLLMSDTKPSHTPEEQMQEQLADYEANLIECVKNGKKSFNKDFYVVVLTKKERLMQNVLRNYFFPTLACPTPTWDQTVYKYLYNTDDLTYMWTIPAKDICKDLVENALFVPAEQRQLLQFVLNFNDGTLLKIAKSENGELSDSPFIDARG